MTLPFGSQHIKIQPQEVSVTIFGMSQYKNVNTPTPTIGSYKTMTTLARTFLAITTRHADR